MDVEKSLKDLGAINPVTGKIDAEAIMDVGRSLNELVAIDPITGEFNPDLIPDDQREEVMKMAESMINWQGIKEQQIRDIKLRELKKNRKKKQPKTFGKNKRKKK